MLSTTFSLICVLVIHGTVVHSSPLESRWSGDAQCPTNNKSAGKCGRDWCRG